MKNFILVSVTVVLLSSCSWIFGKDKNELQPRLGGAARTPLNQNYTQTPQQPQMLGQGQPGAEVFVNQTPGTGNLPQAPGTMPDFMNLSQPHPPMGIPMGEQMQMGVPSTMGIAPNQPPMPPMMMQPPMAMPQQPQPQMQQMAAPAPAPDQAIVQISKTKKLPASLLPNYNNPLNYDGVPETQAMQPVVQSDPIPTLQPSDSPTMPVEEMEITPQPVNIK